MENQKIEKMCNSCDNAISENDNFCSKCGEPLTELSKEFVRNQNKNIQLKLLLKLIEEIKDDKTLLLLKHYIEKLSK